MSDEEKIIDELIEWFKGDADRPAFEAWGVAVEKRPENERQYKQDPKLKGLISIGYEDDYYGTDENLMVNAVGFARQERYIHFAIVIQGKKLYGPDGVLMQLQLARNMAIGFETSPTGPGGRMYIRDCALTSKEATLWGYTLIVRWENLPVVPANSFYEHEQEIGGPITTIEFITGIE